MRILNQINSEKIDYLFYFFILTVNESLDSFQARWEK